jgi:hypothetical protein
MKHLKFIVLTKSYPEYSGWLFFYPPPHIGDGMMKNKAATLYHKSKENSKFFKSLSAD